VVRALAGSVLLIVLVAGCGTAELGASARSAPVAPAEATGASPAPAGGSELPPTPSAGSTVTPSAGSAPSTGSTPSAGTGGSTASAAGPARVVAPTRSAEPATAPAGPANAAPNPAPADTPAVDKFSPECEAYRASLDIDPSGEHPAVVAPHPCTFTEEELRAMSDGPRHVGAWDIVEP
jgi:hypothetical protein